MHLSVVTPAGSVFEGEVESLVAPAHDGYLGVLKGHAPLLTKLGAGVLEAKVPAGSDLKVTVSGGFLQVLSDKISVLAESAKI
ncbi:MAG: ATP synthase F1 subunit epsilon [Planctomycetota bacterium]